MFLVPRKRKITVFTFALSSKNHAIYVQCFCGPVFSIRSYVSLQKSQNACKLQCFGCAFWSLPGGERAEGPKINSSLLNHHATPPLELTSATPEPFLWNPPAHLQPLHGIVPVFGQPRPAVHGQTSITCRAATTKVAASLHAMFP